MELTGLLIIGGYILIGIFVAAAESTMSYSGDFSFLVLLMWPIVIAVLILAVIIYIPMKLGMWTGEIIGRLMDHWRQRND